MNKAIYTIKAAEFLRNVATFDESPAGQALIDSNPRFVLEMLIGEAKKIQNARKG